MKHEIKHYCLIFILLFKCIDLQDYWSNDWSNDYEIIFDYWDEDFDVKRNCENMGRRISFTLNDCFNYQQYFNDLKAICKFKFFFSDP